MEYRNDRESIFNFYSSRMPYYNFDLEKKCNNMLKQIGINELFFFKKSLNDKWNNKGGKLQIYNSTLLEIEEKYHIDKNYLTSSINGIFFNNKYNDMIPLEIFNEVFDTPFYAEYYENIYNTFNYIKNSIYRNLTEDKGSNISKDSLLRDYVQKQSIAYNDLKYIADYLNSINHDGILRSSVSDELLKNCSSINSNSMSKSVLAEAIAFGTTLEKLESKNYEDSKRLLYLPNYEWVSRKI